MEVKLAIAGSTDKLDASDCRLPVLPPGLFELTGLRELSLAGGGPVCRQQCPHARCPA
jgi:hypothetical protein